MKPNKDLAPRIISALLCATLLLSFCGCQSTGLPSLDEGIEPTDSSLPDEDSAPADSTEDTPADSDTSAVFVSADSFEKALPSPETFGLTENTLKNHHYYQLTEDEQTLYIAILDSWTNNDDIFSVQNVDSDLFREHFPHVVDAVYHDRPECFRFTRGYKLKSTIYKGDNNDTVTVTWYKDFYRNVPLIVESKLDDAISEILAAASEGADDYERVRIVHDCLVDRISYDYSSLSDGGELTQWRNTVYSALVEGSAVCGGYARAFQLILNRLGIPCTIVSGFGEKEYHAWSLATLDGENYLFDVTWDDPKDAPTYKYFALTTEEMQKNHTPNTDFSYPTCTATACNYYVREGLLLETYSLDEADRIISDQNTGAAAAVLKFNSRAEFDRAVKDLITDKNWSKLDALKGVSNLKYSRDEEHLILTLYFQTSD